MERHRPSGTQGRSRDHPGEPVGADLLLRPLSRRQLLQAGGALAAAAVLAEACGQSPVPSLLASAAPGSSTGAPSASPLAMLTSDALTRAVSALPADGTLSLPGGPTVAIADLVTAGSTLPAMSGPVTPTPSRNPMAALGLVLACADWSGQSGAVDLSAILPKLPVTPIRLRLPTLPDNAPTDTLAAATPAGLTLRPGAALLLAGVLPDGRLVTAIADPARTVAGHPRLELALLAPDTLAPLVEAAGASIDSSGAIILPGAPPVSLARVDPALAARLVSGAGVLFVDQPPLRPKGSKPVLLADPVVPAPDPSMVTGTSQVSQASDGRILALDAGGNAVGRAEYIGGAPPWNWLGSDGLAWTLREEADAIGWHVGVELTGYLFGQDPWRRIVRAQFNQATAEWGVDWVASEPAQNQFDFSVLDRLVAFATGCGMRVRGHPLVCNAQVPAWVTTAARSSATARSVLENHVSTLVGHGKGTVAEWVVVNEPYLAPYRTNDPFYAALGYEYIDLAFAAARKADPHAVLIYNDTENHASAGTFNGMTTHLTQQTVARLASKGLVDRVGVQMHLDASQLPAPANVVGTLRSYPVPVCITEFDINMSNVGGTLAERYSLQARIATSMLKAVRESAVCESFTVWGIGDGTADKWIQTTGRAPIATPFDAGLKPKPFFTALLRGMR